MSRARNYPGQRREGGAALLVALVLVLISALLGVSAMQSSEIDTQLANNSHFQQTSFRAAEAAADRLLTMGNIVTVANDTSTVLESTVSINEAASVVATFKAFGDGPATGFSLGGQNGFRTLKFVATATATMDAVDSESAVTQGVGRLSSSREN